MIKGSQPKPAKIGSSIFLLLGQYIFGSNKFESTSWQLTTLGSDPWPAPFFTLIMADTRVQVQAGLCWRRIAGRNKEPFFLFHSTLLSLFSESPFIQRNSSVTVSLIIAIPWTWYREFVWDCTIPNIVKLFISVLSSSVNNDQRSSPGRRWNSGIQSTIVHCSAWQLLINFEYIFHPLKPRNSHGLLKMVYLK